VAPVAGMSPEPGGRWVLDVPRPELWSVLHALEEAGHTLVEIKPGLSLEVAFMHVVKGQS
jgi:ABC-2 type transport system ATP-binding protein